MVDSQLQPFPSFCLPSVRKFIFRGTQKARPDRRRAGVRWKGCRPWHADCVRFLKTQAATEIWKERWAKMPQTKPQEMIWFGFWMMVVISVLSFQKALVLKKTNSGVSKFGKMLTEELPSKPVEIHLGNHPRWKWHPSLRGSNMDLHTGQANAYVTPGGKTVGRLKRGVLSRGPGEPNPGWFLIGIVTEMVSYTSPT